MLAAAELTALNQATRTLRHFVAWGEFHWRSAWLRIGSPFDGPVAFGIVNGHAGLEAKANLQDGWRGLLWLKF